MEKILIVVDMQKDFVDGSLGTKEAQSIVPAVKDKIENFEGDIIFTKDTHEEDYLNTQEGQNLCCFECLAYKSISAGSTDICNGWLLRRSYTGKT